MSALFSKIMYKIDSVSRSKHILRHSVVAFLLFLANTVMCFLAKETIFTLHMRYVCAAFSAAFFLMICLILFARLWTKRLGAAEKRANEYAVHTKMFRDDKRSNAHSTLVAYARKSIRLEKRYAKRTGSRKVKRIVLCIHLAPCLSSMESIYTAMLERDDLDPQVVLVPTAQPGMDARMDYSPGLIEYFDRHGYAYKLAYNNGRWLNLLESDPDGIFFQTPYALQLPAMYDPSLALAFPKTMYTPYGPWVMDRSVTAYIDSGIKKPFFDNLTYFFADKLSLEMLDYASPEYMCKAVLSGSPKVDFNRLDQCPDTYCWKGSSKTGKRVLWLPRWGFADNRTSFMDYYEYFLEKINDNEVSFVIRPHPLMFKDLLKCGLFTQEGVEQLKEMFDSPENSAIDNGYDYREGLLSCDFIIADFTSIMYEYLPTGKPIIYTPKDNTLVDPRIIEACYVVRNQSEVRAVFEMLLRGEDPKREERLRLVEALGYFPHGEKSNGHFIAKYVAENL